MALTRIVKKEKATTGKAAPKVKKPGVAGKVAKPAKVVKPAVEVEELMEDQIEETEVEEMEDVVVTDEVEEDDEVTEEEEEEVKPAKKVTGKKAPAKAPAKGKAKAPAKAKKEEKEEAKGRGLKGKLSARVLEAKDKNPNTKQVKRDEFITVLKDKIEEIFETEILTKDSERILKAFEETLDELVLSQGKAFNLNGKLIKRTVINGRTYKAPLEGIDFENFKFPHVKLTWTHELNPRVVRGETTEDGIFVTEDGEEINMEEVNENFRNENK